jgi:abortive infection bacteriophage resistance protein
MCTKDFKTYDQQIKKLQSRGLNFNDIEEAKKILKFENYYKLINGYNDLFLDPNSQNEKYKDNLHFSEIYSLYKFDEELRFIFFKRILSIENQIKSIIAYEFSKNHDGNSYLSTKNYNSIYKSTFELNKLVKTLTDIITPNIYNKQSLDKRISHYNSKYGFVPLWVLINLITFGNASYFFKFMNPKEQNEVSRSFKVKPNILNNYLKMLTIVRNICAHNERLFSLKFRTQIASSVYKQNFHTSQSYNNRNDLFSLLIILKQLVIEPKEFEKMKKEIEEQINILTQNLISIKIDEVLNEMGFPKNWNAL